MGFCKGTGPRRCPGCRAWLDVQDVKMVKIGGRFYCPKCGSRLKRRANSKRVTARAVAG